MLNLGLSFSTYPFGFFLMNCPNLMFSFDYIVRFFLLVVANKLEKMAIEYGWVLFYSKVHLTKYFIVSFQISPLLNVKISMVTQTPSLFVAACKKQFSTAQRSHGQVRTTI